jgi:hypothetical protein
MISISIACALIIYLFGYLDSADGRGIASAAKLMCRKASQQQTQLDYRT